MFSRNTPRVSMKPTATRLNVLVCILLVQIALAGCSQWHYTLGAPLTDLDTPQLQAQSTLAEVLAVLGPPQRISASDNGYILAWEHWRVSENVLGVSLGVLGAEFLNADWGTTRARGDFLLVTFDQRHQLSSATSATWDSDAGGGQAVQPLFSFVEVVEVEDLVRHMPQHVWGASLLQELPQTLNAGSSPDTGAGGIEQRGTPGTMGQRSLELR